MNVHFALTPHLLVSAALILNACGEPTNGNDAITLSEKAGRTAHFNCAFVDPEENTRFEFKFSENADKGTLSYKYSPVGDPAVVEGSFPVKLAAASWSAYLYLGNDMRASAKLNTPRNPRQGAVRLEMSVVVSGKTLEPRQFLECQEIR